MPQEEKQASNYVPRRGFAALDAEQRRRIASMGGRAAHEKGTAHEFTSEEAAAAGRKRGQGVKKSGNQLTPVSEPTLENYASV